MENNLQPDKLSKWAREIYDNAKNHGWHDHPLSREHFLGLIMSEVAEAIEADRNGRRSDMESFNERMSSLDGSDECFKEMYKRYIKGSIEEEFADVMIRLLDMAQCAYGDKMIWRNPALSVYDDSKSFIEQAWHFVRTELGLGCRNICNCVLFMYEWAQDLGIDLDKHIELKMRYNELRPYKHGGKKY